jgi:hypothetical protein
MHQQCATAATRQTWESAALGWRVWRRPGLLALPDPHQPASQTAEIDCHNALGHCPGDGPPRRAAASPPLNSTHTAMPRAQRSNLQLLAAAAANGVSTTRGGGGVLPPRCAAGLAMHALHSWGCMHACTTAAQQVVWRIAATCTPANGLCSGCIWTYPCTRVLQIDAPI